MNIINILREKGYSGENDFFKISKWLQEKGIFVDLVSTWSEDGKEFIGYKAVFWFNPYESSYSTQTMNSSKDAFYIGILAIKDFV